MIHAEDSLLSEMRQLAQLIRECDEEKNPIERLSFVARYEKVSREFWNNTPTRWVHE